MAKRPKKVIILGLDAPIAPRLYKYCKEGKLPALGKVIENGVWARHALVPLPTITPPNWTSISTGAWPSTHGITDFNVHTPGDPLDRTHGGFYSGDVKAEFVWNAIARAGKKSVVVNYPGTWPPVMKDGIQIGGAGVETNMWFYPTFLFRGKTSGSPPALDASDPEVASGFAQHGAGISQLPPVPRVTLSFNRCFSTQKWETKQGAPEPLALKEPSGWSNLPPVKKALEAELVFRPSVGLYRLSPPVWQMLVLDTNGDGYDRVLICDGKDASSPMAELKKGQWSSVITRDFQTDEGVKKGSFALKLLELSCDARDVRLYHSAICSTEGWCYPESLAAEIKSERGLPHPQTGFDAFDRGWIDADTAVEIAEFERQWYSDACTYILKNKPWDLFMMHFHPPDHAWHSISWLMDPATAKSEAEWKKYQEVELAVYQVCDRLAADLFACADEDETVFAIISDHGAKATNGPFPDVNRILQDAGLLARDKDGKVDWSRTRAVWQRVVWVYVNLKGRDPDGIVEPGKEYRQVQDEVINALSGYVDPTTGKKPIVLALRKEDARFINIYGDYVGDVVFAMSEEFGPQHGPYLPTAEWGLGSLHGTFAMSGPGIKKGVELERNVWCLDMIPTLCYLAGWPMPRDAEGAIIFQALEEPDPR